MCKHPGARPIARAVCSGARIFECSKMVAGQSSMAGVCLFQAVSGVVLVALLSLVAADEIVISLDGDKWLLSGSDSSGRVKGLQACSRTSAH